MSSSVVRVETHSESATRAIGRVLGRQLAPGDCVSLSGDLGAGKTRLVQGIAGGMEIDAEEVSSPTFVLCHVYEGPTRLLHVDAYRLKDASEFEALGVLESIGNREGVLVIEWGEKIAEALPVPRVDVVIVETGPASRLIEMDFTHARPELRSAVRRLLGGSL